MLVWLSDRQHLGPAPYMKRRYPDLEVACNLVAYLSKERITHAMLVVIEAFLKCEEVHQHENEETIIVCQESKIVLGIFFVGNDRSTFFSCMWWRNNSHNFHSDSDYTANSDSNPYVDAQPYSYSTIDGCDGEDR